MSSANVLSVDLDWFNAIDQWSDKQKAINDFFENLASICLLPNTIFYLKEHHYLYPLSLLIMQKYGFESLNIINFDEHHDFYPMSDIQWDSEEVNCGNFFGFMAFDGLINEYIWMTNSYGNQYMSDVENFKQCLCSKANSDVHKFSCNTRAIDRLSCLPAIAGKSFDIFVVVQSPSYVHEHSRVNKHMNALMQNFCSNNGCVLKRNKCQSRFGHQMRFSQNIHNLLE